MMISIVLLIAAASFLVAGAWLLNRRKDDLAFLLIGIAATITIAAIISA